MASFSLSDIVALGAECLGMVVVDAHTQEPEVPLAWSHCLKKQGIAVFPVFSVCHIQGRASSQKLYRRKESFSAVLIWGLASATSSLGQDEWKMLKSCSEKEALQLGAGWTGSPVFLAAAVGSRPLHAPPQEVLPQEEGREQSWFEYHKPLVLSYWIFIDFPE